MKADIRTDLAMEARELHAAGTGVSEQNEQREGYAISRIRIETDEAAKALGKAKGLYVTYLRRSGADSRRYRGRSQ